MECTKKNLEILKKNLSLFDENKRNMYFLREQEKLKESIVQHHEEPSSSNLSDVDGRDQQGMACAVFFK